MKFEEYVVLFESILKDPTKYPLYTDEEYFNFTKLNWSRMSRWLKKFQPEQSLLDFFNAINEKQTWIVITEPWCGDAAHSVSQIYKLVEGNPNITLDIQLRDEEPFLIDQYLTNGGKAIPILIIRDQEGNDLGVWGPRPSKAQELFLELKSKGLEFDAIKEAIQKWYNEDKGVEIQFELKDLLTKS